MASTYTINKSSVFGDMRVQFADLYMTDGDAASAIPTGMAYIYQAIPLLGAKHTAAVGSFCTINCGTNGYISMVTAASAVTVPVVVFGY